MRKKTKNKPNLIFAVLYITEFLGACIISMLSNSFFAYEIFNELWADILYCLLFALIYVTAFVQEILSSRKPRNIIANAFIFIGSMILFVLMYTVGKIFILLAPIYSAAMVILIAVRYALKFRIGEATEIDIKQLISSISLLFFGMLASLSINFVDELYLAWSIIPAAVLTIFASLTAFLLLKNQFKSQFYTKVKRIGISLIIVSCVFVVAFFYSFTALAISNRLFDGDPVPTEYIVLEKHIQSGSKQLTQFELKVNIDGKDKWIVTPVVDYHEISEGDTVIINYYKGALGFAYYVYGEKSN